MTIDARGELTSLLQDVATNLDEAQLTLSTKTVRDGVALIEAQSATIERMREALIRCGRAVGAGLADNVSTEFLLLVPGEVEAKIAALATKGRVSDGEARD